MIEDESMNPEVSEIVEPPTFKELESDKTFGVLYNHGWGFFRLWPEAWEAIAAANLPYTRDCTSLRVHQGVIEVVKRTFNSRGKRSKLRIASVPEPLVRYIRIDELDGYETIEYNWEKLYAGIATMIASGQLKSIEEVSRYTSRVIELSKHDMDGDAPVDISESDTRVE